MYWIFTLAQAAGQGGGQGTGGGAGGASALYSLVVPMLILLAIFYFLLIRPQRKQEKQRQEMLSNLKKNDKVVTIGGIHGIVADVREDDVTLKVDESGNVRLRVTRNGIGRVLGKDAEGDGE